MSNIILAKQLSDNIKKNKIFILDQSARREQNLTFFNNVIAGEAN
jgi:hypothetical protein